MPQMESFCYQGRSKGIQEIKEPNVSSTEMYSGTSQLLLIRSQNLRATKKHLKSLNKRAANAKFCCFFFLNEKYSAFSVCFEIELMMVFKIYSASLSWLVSHLS